MTVNGGDGNKAVIIDLTTVDEKQVDTTEEDGGAEADETLEETTQYMQRTKSLPRTYSQQPAAGDNNISSSHSTTSPATAASGLRRYESLPLQKRPLRSISKPVIFLCVSLYVLD